MNVALVMNDNFSMLHFRGALLKKIVQEGHKVTAIVPPGPCTGELTALGVKCVEVPIERFISPLRDIRLMVSLFRIFRRENFDAILNMTIKPNIFGTFAAKAARVPHTAALVSGLGFAFSKPKSFFDRLILATAKALYKLAFRYCDTVWFQNPDDLDYFISMKMLVPQKGVVIKGGGIDTKSYNPSSVASTEISTLREELNISHNAHCILMFTARMVWSKGVKEYLDSALMLQKDLPDWTFVMLCPFDQNSPDSVPKEYIAKNQHDNVRIITSFQRDIKKFIALSDIVVLPSYYHEGVPRSLLEALAMAKPIITTEHPGCKEVVRCGWNGYLVPTKDSSALADSIRLVAKDPLLRTQFGSNSRRLAEETFSDNVVLPLILKKILRL